MDMVIIGRTWLTPFSKQCFVTIGAAINLAQFGLVMAFTAVLLPQLRRPDSIVPIDDNSGSWIAAVPGLALVVGNFTIPPLMGRYGRKIASLVSVSLICIGWFCIVAAKGVPSLIIARLLQGLSMGMSTSLVSILVGEYTSPKNRGAFLSAITLSMGVGTLSVHAIGAFCSWKITALYCAIITTINLIIVIYSPESPSWLADQGRYEDCERVFHWLRGDAEEDELRKMIEASQIMRESKIDANVNKSPKKFGRGFKHFCKTVKKKELYKPIIIMTHLYAIGNWSGIHLLSGFMIDTVQIVMGTDQYNNLLAISVDVQRVITSFCAVFIIKRMRRRTLLLGSTFLNILALVGTGGYTFARIHGLLPFDHPIIGGLLIHIHMFSMMVGNFPLAVVIAGEVFPLQYRSLAGGISALIFSFQFFALVKTVLVLFKTVGLSGAYFIYAGILTYCLVVSWFILPETKDRTLQDIEEEFRGMKMTPEDVKLAQSLHLQLKA